MAFLCVQNFTLLQKRIEISVANSMVKRNHQCFCKITNVGSTIEHNNLDIYLVEPTFNKKG
jgi:hypothetical protein